MPPKGVRQRLGLDKKPELNPKAKARMSKFCKDMVRTGRLSSAEIGEAAAGASELAHSASSGSAASSSCVVPDDVRRIAAVKRKAEGPVDRHENKNASRSIMNIYRKKAEWPPTYGIKVQVWDHVKTRIKETTMQILPPHELLNHLVQQGQVEDWCVAQPSQEGFVTELSAWGKRMGVETAEGQWVPIGLWGDSAPSFKKDSVYLLTWKPLLGNIRKRYWIATFSKREICKCGCQGRHTLAGIFDAVAWSMRALLAGEHPAVDHTGKNPAGFLSRSARRH